MRKLRAFLALPAEDKWRLVQALVLLPVVGLGLRLTTLKRVRAVLARLSSSPPSPDPQAMPGLVHRSVRMVELSAGHGPYSGNCLKQSLVLWWLLRRDGIDSEIRVGVRHEESRFEAHAWVERLRVPLNDRAGVVPRYTPFERPIQPESAEHQRV